MKLISLQLTARGVTGWASPLLTFGTRTTSIFAKNGSGKTPIVHAVAFCLGYPVSFRADINDKCEAAVLTVQLRNATSLLLKRFIGTDFSARITLASGKSADYFSEADYSNALFALLGMRVPALVSNVKQVTQPYMATVLPLFYLNQDFGYSEAYRPPRSFISDQFVEMIRFVFGLAPRHSFEAQKDLLEAKETLNTLNVRIVEQQKRVAQRASEVDESDIDSLDQEIGTLKEQLGRLRDALSSKGTTNDAVEELLAIKDESLRTTRREIDQLRDRLRGIATIRSEIDAEMQTLALNEEAKRVFESFPEICKNPDCGLFIGSTEAYAKNLLYLKDQLKDLVRNEQIAKVRVGGLEDGVRQHEREREEIASKIAPDGTDAQADAVLAAIRQVSVDLYNADQRKAALVILANERAAYMKLEAERDRVQDRIAILSRVGHADLEFNKIRLSLRSRIVRWLDILETVNVKRDVDIELDFRITFGGEKIETINGSTKIRVVLAIHAALFEEYLLDPARPFRFLILDTPKQQEIQTKDLADYLAELSSLAGKENAQLIFSTTEYRFPCGVEDAEWTPSFEGPVQPMYLGPIARPPQPS